MRAFLLKPDKRLSLAASSLLNRARHHRLYGLTSFAAAMPYFFGYRPHYRRTFGLLLIEPFLLSFRAGERIRVAALARFSVAGLAKS